MSGDAYEKADNLVNVQLKKQVDEKGIESSRKNLYCPFKTY